MSGELIVVQHEAQCTADWFGQWWAEAGLGLQVVRGDLDDEVPEDLGGSAGLVVLGGEMGANDDATHPWLTATKGLIAQVVAREAPFLGICLGHQLAAVALGGAVERNPLGEAVGLTPVARTGAGRRDELLGLVQDGVPALQWNRDVVTRMPPGGQVLARAPDASVQAARYGVRAWGVQFHPEASAGTFRRWTSDPALVAAQARRGVDVEHVARSIEAATPALRAVWRPVALAFAAVATAAS